MVIIVKFAALFILAIGILFLVNPNIMKKYVAFWCQDSRIHICASINLIVGMIFLLATSQCKAPLVVIIVANIFLVKGIVLFGAGLKKAKTMLNKWGDKPQGTIRLIALLAIGIGILLRWAI